MVCNFKYTLSISQYLVSVYNVCTMYLKSNATVTMYEYHILGTMWDVIIALVKCVPLNDKWGTFYQYNGDTSQGTQNVVLVTKALVVFKCWRCVSVLISNIIIYLLTSTDLTYLCLTCMWPRHDPTQNSADTCWTCLICFHLFIYLLYIFSLTMLGHFKDSLKGQNSMPRVKIFMVV